MAYVKDTDILDVTNGGLEIILYYYPDAGKVIHKSARRFKIRQSEKTASASLKQLENGVWVVTDFGGDSKPRNGIHVCALEEGISYAEACNVLGVRYNIKGAGIEPVKPRIVKRPLESHESSGDFLFEAKDFTKQELALLGPRVNAVHCKEYSLVSLASVTYCKENEATVIYSTPEYPIFMFDFGTWQKIYQPNASEKRWRFQYAGVKPSRHMFGLDILKREFADTKKKQEEESLDDIDEAQDNKKKKKDPRLDAVFLCSGGSDGLNLRSFGKIAIWFNSESEHLEYAEYRDIKRMAKEIYYVADIDSSGIKQAVALGLKYLDIKLLWLPEKLKTFRDKRGNPRKDFKDYVEIYYRHEEKTLVFQNGFNKLIDNALPLQFWTEHYDKEGKLKFNISNTRLYHFLEMLGFGRYESDNFKDGYIYVRKDGNIVKILEPYQIANFIHYFLADRGMSPDLRDYVYRSPQLNEKSFSNLPAITIDFTSAYKHTQYQFYTNRILKITPQGIEELRHGDIDNYVWEDKVIDFNLRLSEPHFDIKVDKDGDMDIKILKHDNMFFNFLINASRIHWKQELEEAFEGRPQKEADEYFAANKFNIAGPNLSADQQLEQKLHLINKIYSIGYLLHNYKNYNKPWAIFAMDNKISELGESHGGSGKSLCYSFLNKVLKRRHYLKGRDPKLTQNEFIYSGVTEDTDYIMVDDSTQYLNFDFFFSEITGSLKVNPKNKDPYEIPFEKSPKFVFTSNFGMRNMDPSTFRRLLITVFSDYYHSSQDNDEYKQARKVSDDFDGRNLFTDFSESDYNDVYNFWAQCIKFYLSHEQKVDPPMDNVTKRNLQVEMGDAFMGWADAFFDTEDVTGHKKYLDAFFSKEAAFDEFARASKTKWTANKFKKAMKAYCHWNNWVFNPKEYQNTQGRIIQKIEGKSQEAFYIGTSLHSALANVHRALKDDEDDGTTVFDR